MTRTTAPYDNPIKLWFMPPAKEHFENLAKCCALGEKIGSTSKVVMFLLDLALKRIDQGLGLPCSPYIGPWKEMESVSVRMPRRLLARVEKLMEEIRDPEGDNLEKTVFIAGLVGGALTCIHRWATAQAPQEQQARDFAPTPLQRRAAATMAVLERRQQEEERELALPEPATAEDALWRKMVGAFMESHAYRRMREGLTTSIATALVEALAAEPAEDGHQPSSSSSDYKKKL